MLKYIKHHIDTILGIEIYPIISLLIFFVFFIGLISYLYFMDKNKIEKFSKIPLSEDSHEK